MRKSSAKKASERKGTAGTIILVIILLAGVCVLLYPTVSEWWNSRVQSYTVSVYNEAVAAMDEEDYEALLEAAQEYNELVAAIGSPGTLTNTDLIDEDYWDLLDVSGDGVIGYVTIEKINVELPIYHGADSRTMSQGAGHLEGSSLPVGGESTHSVLVSHRGLTSAVLFSNLDQLEEGDIFTITVLDQVLTYQVDKISIVLPDEIEDLYIEEGKDYCTLMTCTPYGINTHRLLVRGVRIDNIDDSTIVVSADASQIDTIIVAFFIAVPLLLILLIVLLVSTRKVHENNSKV